MNGLLMYRGCVVVFSFVALKQMLILSSRSQNYGPSVLLRHDYNWRVYIVLSNFLLEFTGEG